MKHSRYFLFSILLFITPFITTCGTSKTKNCIDESKISDGPCTMEYKPVCGCDGKTYSNTCVAGRAGVTSWKSGECVDD